MLYIYFKYHSKCWNNLFFYSTTSSPALQSAENRNFYGHHLCYLNRTFIPILLWITVYCKIQPRLKFQKVWKLKLLLLIKWLLPSIWTLNLLTIALWIPSSTLQAYTAESSLVSVVINIDPFSYTVYLRSDVINIL